MDCARVDFHWDNMMKIIRLGEWKEAVAWTIGGVCVMILCLAVTFPYDALHAMLLAEINGATGMEVLVGDRSVKWPVGIEWRNVTVSKPAWGSLRLEVLQAKLGILKALGGGLGLDVVLHVDEASPSAGVARGTLAASSFSLAGPVAVKGQLVQVDLSRVLGRNISRGMLNGEFSLQLDSVREAAGEMTGEGTWKAEIRDLVFDQIALGNGRTISLVFTTISAGFICRDAVCDITELKGDGIDGSFTGQGKITVQRPTADSRLALAVTLIPGAGFSQKASILGLPPLLPGNPMTVRIAGTLADPRISL